LLGVLAPAPAIPRTVREWRHNGVDIAELLWQTGFGPPTRAWLVLPAARSGPLPGILALHCHAGVKSVGAERLIATPAGERLRQECYGGHALAERLAHAGFAVLAHDAFSWGARRFLLTPEPWRLRSTMAALRAAGQEAGYDTAAALHESTVAKFAGVMGTSFAGAVAHDDVTALGVLAELPGVDSGRLGVVGFSGGGGRAAVLTALDGRVRASVIACMMSTLDSLYPAYLDAHSWLLATPGIGHDRDWPDVAFAGGRHDQLVLYAADDALFPPEGMARADALLGERFASAVGTYKGITVPGPHRFDGLMQEKAIDFLAASLST
jgi:dienelactone hydrolase